MNHKRAWIVYEEGQISFSHWCWALLVLTSALTVSPQACADSSSNHGTLSIIFENDIFSNEDKHYTNGVGLIWIPEQKKQPEWVYQLIELVPWMPKQGKVAHGYAFGQNMYTPDDITWSNPPSNQRPYAGWLYGAVGVGVETGKELDQLSFTFGMVGPASLADQTQKFVHKVVNSDEPMGWNTQLKNEPGVILTYQHSWREATATTLAGFRVDLTPYYGGALGNVYTYADTGLTVRWGRRLPNDYGPIRIQPSSPGSGMFTPSDKFGWYLFVGIEGRAVARNIFLDGNTFVDSRSVDKETLVGDLQFGGVLSWKTMRLAYTQVMRTREYVGQPRNDNFGAISWSIIF